MVGIATQYQALLQRVRLLDVDDPAIKELRDRATQALEAGDYQKADGLPSQAEEANVAKGQQLKEASDKYFLNAAATRGERGRIALTQLQYLAAAAHFRAAREEVPEGHPDQRRTYQWDEADALYHQGDEKGDNAALGQAIAVWHVLLKVTVREEVPLDWAMTQNNLGNALEALGAREGDTKHLEDAVTAYGEALKEYTRERVPLQWAATQNNLSVFDQPDLNYDTSALKRNLSESETALKALQARQEVKAIAP